MNIIYDQSARAGQRYGVELNSALVHRLSRQQITAHLRSKGISHKQIRDAIAIAKAEAVATSEQRAQALQRFINSTCFAVPGALIPFSEFYGRFIEQLPRDERHSWSRYRVSHALPENHKSGSYKKNQKFVANLAWQPGEAGKPFAIVAGDKSQGRARVLVQSTT